MKEFISLGHMEEVPPAEIVRQGCTYLPHLAVRKESSTTTKLRTVFHASFKTEGGVSLNDALYIGPVLQRPLREIIRSFRLKRIAFVADVEKMFRMVVVHPEDRDYQRIVWRDDPAPRLRKWASNEPVVLAAIPPADRALDPRRFGDHDEAIGALGLNWHPRDDNFSFRVRVSNEEKRTRRVIASESARIFDPLGILSPLTIAIRILIQDTWVSDGIDWDTPLPQDLTERWQHLRDELPLLDRIRVPRWMRTCRKFQLHGFADASTKAYCAAVYIRVIDEQGDVNVQLLEARSSVAPTKTITLAHLELCAALLLAELLQQITNSMEGLELEVFAWTDAADVLYWLSSHPSKWVTFVANRTAKIQQILPAKRWRHVDGKANPADLATRGLSPSELLSAELWWNGPDWLKLDIAEWPVTKITAARDEAMGSEQPLAVHIAASRPVVETEGLIYRYSSVLRVLRISAWCRMFITKCRRRVSDCADGDQDIGKRNAENETAHFPLLTAADVQAELRFYARLSQQESFPDELSHLTRKRPVKKRSPLHSLCPFLDDEGLIRVSGRLTNADIASDAKRPIILSSHNRFTELLVLQLHESLLHAGPLLMSTSLRRHYWVIGARNLIRKVYRNCTICFRLQKQTARQKMGDLPTVQVTPAPAFDRTGVDYAGPFRLRNMKGRTTCASNHATEGHPPGRYRHSARGRYLAHQMAACSRREDASWRRWINASRDAHRRKEVVPAEHQTLAISTGKLLKNIVAPFSNLAGGMLARKAPKKIFHVQRSK